MTTDDTDHSDDAGFSGTSPGAGSIGLLVTSAQSTPAELAAAIGAAGCEVEAIGILEGGLWYIYVPGAPDVVNAEFPASLAPTTPFFVRCREDDAQ